MSRPRKNLLGIRFGRLVVLSYAGFNNHKKSAWNCICDCGTERTVDALSLLSSNTKSCGCLKITHGLTRGCKGKMPPEYNAWKGARRRCTDSEDVQFHNYGGRGIKMCQRWMESYANFLSDMGPKPDPSYTIERKNSNGDYEPSNCKWATTSEQARNRSTNVRISCGGMTKCIADWEIFFSLKKHALRGKTKERVEELVINLFNERMAA